MISFLIKICFIAIIVFGLYSVYQFRRTGELPKQLQVYADKLNIPALISLGKLTGLKVEPKDVGKNLSSALDQLVTHSNTNSPIVLGVKVTNDSLGALVDVLQKLPTEQLDQLKVAICASPSAASE